MTHRISVVDSHTAGEPTRVVVDGGPDLGNGPLAGRLRRFHEQHDRFRRAIVTEPRGSDILVGALLCAPVDSASAAAVIFFNNVGYLGMCGHGMMGVVRTLAHLGRLQPGSHRIESPVGPVGCTLSEQGDVSVENVPSWRKAADVRIDVDGIGRLAGDVAYGGNWFFLAREPVSTLDMQNAAQLLEVASRIRRAVNAQGFPEVDHVELFGPPTRPGADARNFVLCPGGAYDRSPCGTGTSAKLACLAADGQLAEGRTWVQEGITGTTFEASYRTSGTRIVPTVTGRAWITGEATLLVDPADPFAWGLPPA
ncbi:MAG: proline racemase family protein [Verrucomicrobiales bacterium]|nr:proline racemase family protein [Verrucomicrobiales bacterium]MCP5528232.1 proline racemase family protein [Verrucomicrobiales bacterium]